VEDTDGSPGEFSSSDNDSGLEEKVTAAKISFGKGLDDLLCVGKDLLTTEEGRKHIGKTMDSATREIMGTLDEAARQATDYVNSLLEKTRK